MPATIVGIGANDSFGFGRDTIDLFIPVGTEQEYTDAIWTDFKSTTEANKALNLNVFLQGASLNPNAGEENLMRDDLRVAGLIPATSPYVDLAAASSTAFDATGEDAIVDWIFIELRDANDNASVLESASALLQRDGDVVGLDGVSLFEFTTTPDDYFIAIKHRNHLGIMVEAATKLSSVATVLDFSRVNSPITFGTNAQSDFGMLTNRLGMWAGDVSNDARVRFLGIDNDTNPLKDIIGDAQGDESNDNLFQFTGYSKADVDMNGNIRFQGPGNDSNIIKDIILNNPGNLINRSNLFIIEAQLTTTTNTLKKNKDK